MKASKQKTCPKFGENEWGDKSKKPIKRTRQNVILEVGYFWWALGRRGNVAFLVDDLEMELPSDILLHHIV